MLVNGDESEPGTCKDHVIFREDPHSVIEGTMIAGLAVGAKMGFIYLRGEYRYLLNIMEKAVADAYAKGFLGKNIFGKEGLDFDIVTQTGAGAYEVGEESALMESLEGKRGIPRIRPPFPAVVGLYGGPTIINNAETIANAPHILLMGGEEYAKLGTERNGGTRLFGISGHVERPGVYELPMGYSLRKAIYEVAGGIKGGKQLKAVVPGGARARCCGPMRSMSGWTSTRWRRRGRCSGRAGLWCSTRRSHRRVRAADDQVLPARELRLVHSLPRRHGLDQEDADARVRRRRQKKDIDNVQYLAENMMGRTFCPLGDAAAMPTLGFVKKFRKEFEDYIDGKKRCSCRSNRLVNLNLQEPISYGETERTTGG